LIQKIIYKIKGEFKSEFGKNFFTLFTGMGVSQIIPIVVTPILTRLFTPAEFGLLALFTSTSLFMSNIATMQYDSAIMLPEKEKEAINIMALALISVITITMLTLVIVVVFNIALCKLMGNTEIGFWLYFVPLLVLLEGIFRILNIWASRRKQFKRLALRNINQAVTTAGTKVVIGSLHTINGGLIIGSLVGQFTATFVLFYQTIIKDKLSGSIITIKCILYNAVKYKEFPIFANFQNLFDMFKETGTRYIISNFYGTAILGSYSFTLGLLQRPTQLIGGAISQVYYQKAANTYNAHGNLWGLTMKLMMRLTIFSFVIYLPILLYGQEIFYFVFGNKWKTAGLYAQILTPWLVGTFILQVSSRIPQIVNKQKVFFIIGTIFNIIFFLGVLILSMLKFDFIYVLSCMTILTSVFYVYLLFWYKKITQIN